MTKKSSPKDVELNVTAMLDMAFQLLAFFVMTFQQPPLEGQIAMRLPPAEAMTESPRIKPINPSGVQSAETLAIKLHNGANGHMLVSIGSPNEQEHPVAFASLEAKLNDSFLQGAGAFRQVVIQAAPGVRWEDVMKTMDICSRQQKADGSKLDKLSFVCLPNGQ